MRTPNLQPPFDAILDRFMQRVDPFYGQRGDTRLIDYSEWYYLIGKVPIPLPRGVFPTPPMSRRVAFTRIGGAVVSTAFLQLDHAFTWEGGPPKGRPILFEMMVFGGPLDGEQERYHTWREAEIGHAEWVRRVAYTQTRRYAAMCATKRALIMARAIPGALLAAWVAFEEHIDSRIEKESDQ